MMKIYEKEVSEYSQIDDKNGGLIKIPQGILVIFTQSLLIEKATIIDSTAMIFSDRFILSNSRLTASSNGCNKLVQPGSPHLFISHSFVCGKNAGSYGGRGGIGINIKKKEETMKCIRNSLGRMTIYGDPFNPYLSGAKGAIIDPHSESSSPSNIVIVSFQLILRSSTVDASSNILGENRKRNYSSGGGVLIVSKKLRLESGDSYVLANGMDSDITSDGAGGGGRIHYHDLCWYEEFLNYRKETSQEYYKKEINRKLLNLKDNPTMNKAISFKLNSTFLEE